VKTPLAEILAALDKVQRSRLPRTWARAKPGELILLRSLADALREELETGGSGKHRASVLTRVKKDG
jgi:hypothetical protein